MKDLIDQMRRVAAQCARDLDDEKAHVDADAILVAALRKVADPLVEELIESYESIPKWYA